MSLITSRKLDRLTPFSREEIEETRGAGETRVSKSRGDTLLSGGDWGLGPFAIHWEFKNDDEIDIDGSFFGFKIVHLSGTLTRDDVTIAGEAGVDFARVRAAIEAEWNGPDAGLFVEGELVVFGIDKKFKHKIASW